jgi:hypothetical protein
MKGSVLPLAVSLTFLAVKGAIELAPVSEETARIGRLVILGLEAIAVLRDAWRRLAKPPSAGAE